MAHAIYQHCISNLCDAQVKGRCGGAIAQAVFCAHYDGAHALVSAYSCNTRSILSACSTLALTRMLMQYKLYTVTLAVTQ
jgi:hypothetical protein